MQVKQRLKINAAISVAAAVAIVLVFSLSLYRLNKANNLAKISGDIILNAFEKVTLRNDYSQNGSERAKTQWFARHEEIGKILKAASQTFQDPEDKTTIEKLFKNQESILKIFSAIIGNREKTTLNAEAAAISNEVEERLISQLNIKVYETVLHGSELLESSRKARAAALRQSGTWTAFVLIFFIGAIIINSLTMTRAITDRVQRLRDGALVIGRGDLDHRIDIKGDDEFADLSGAFNEMTVKLRTTYHDLSTEVEERKHAEAALRESREDLERAQAVGQVGSWRLDTRRNILTWSDENHRIFGLPKGTPLSYETFLSTIHSSDRQYVDTQWQAGMRGAPYDIEHRIVVDGQVKWVREKANLEFDTAGQLLGGFGITQDITERKKTEEALKESEERFRNMFERHRAVMLLIEPETGTIVDANASAAEFYGWPIEMLRSLLIQDLNQLPPDDVAAERKRALEEDRNYFVFSHKLADGRVRWVEVYSSPITVQGRSLLFSIIHDITERKRAEDALRRAHEDLEIRVQDRTKELKEAERSLREINETLEQRVAERTAEVQTANKLLRASRRAALNLMEDAVVARKQAEKANAELKREIVERKKAEDDVLKLSEDMAARNLELESLNNELEAFIYSVSHDLRGPLRTMGAFASFLHEEYSERLDGQAKDYLARISQSSAKMSRLIEDLLDLSRLSRQEVNPTEVDMSALANSIVSGLREVNPGRNVEISIEDSVTASTDPSLTEIILSNLIGNAWKFTSKTGNALIGFGTLEKDGNRVYYVRDNGAGFDPQYAAKMFQPFHRFHSDDDFEGTGIGLSIVERVIRRLGGKVWAEGEVGKGATIYFTLG